MLCLATSAFPAELKLVEPQQVRILPWINLVDWWTINCCFGVKIPTVEQHLRVFGDTSPD
jgi:hypothetical protein